MNIRIFRPRPSGVMNERSCVYIHTKLYQEDNTSYVSIGETIILTLHHDVFVEMTESSL
jgi:hypothetical protein